MTAAQSNINTTASKLLVAADGMLLCVAQNLHFAGLNAVTTVLNTAAIPTRVELYKHCTAAEAITSSPTPEPT